MDRAQREDPGTSRRAVLAVGSVGAAAAVAGAVSGCAVYGQPGPPPAGSGSGGGNGAGNGSGTPVVGTAEVPVGGGVIEAGLGVVVTQPASGQFRGFSATCTHQGCRVAEVDDGTINCFCHGSRFSIEDGAVVQAALGLDPDQQAPLPEVGIAVEGDTVVLR
jgi:Rieske Fe-S protein